MALDKKHYLPKKSDREYKGHFHPLYKLATPNKREYDRIESLLEEVVCDVVNGKSKSDIILKAQNGLYENQSKGVVYNTALEYYNAALSRLQVDEVDKDNAKTIIYGQYLNLYKEMMEEGNLIGAKQVLDSLTKLMGLDKPDNQTNVQINNNNDGTLSINFGFSEQ